MKELKNERIEILRTLKFNTPLKNQFFRELAKTSNPFPWLEDLIDEGYFDPETYPGPKEVPDKKGYFTMPYWEPSGYLENLAKLNYRDNDQKTTRLLTEIVDNYIKHDFIERNYRTDYLFLKVIFYLPKDEITSEHINFISIALNSKWDSSLIQSELSKTPIKKLIEYNRKDLLIQLLDIILNFKKKSGEYYDEYNSIMDEFWLNKTLESNKDAIAQFCALDACKVAKNKMLNILNCDEHQFVIPAIEDHPQTMFHGEYDNQLVYFVRDMIEHSYSKEVRELIIEFKDSNFSIFKRIAIHSINYYYDYLNDIFWNWENNPLDDYKLKHEIYRLFKLRHEKFENDDEKINTVIKWIDNEEYIVNLEKESSEPIKIAYEKLKWLSAFKESKNQKIQLLIQEYKEIYPDKIDHPDFDIWIEGPIIVGPKKSDELCEKSNKELSEYLNEKDELKSVFDKSEISESFIKCVSDNPTRFTKDLEPFLDVSKENQYNLIYGLLSAWRSEKTFECQEIFDFLLQILEDNDFWKEDYTNKTNYRNWIVSVVADFIEIGTIDDRYAFENELLPTVEKILLILIKNTEAELPKMHDLVTSVLNSPLGKIFSSMIVFSMKCFRETEKFPNAIKSEIGNQLENPPTELLVTIGRFLPNLCAIDREWVKNNIKLIFSDNDNRWKSTVIGYLFYSSTIYTDIYNLLKNEGYYGKAINADFEDRYINQRLIQHICTFYLKNEEKLDDPDSLISKLINHKNIQQVSFLINFISSRKESITIDQIKPLWYKLIDTFSENGNAENCVIIAKLARWLELVEEIDDDIFNWLILSAKCMKSQTSMSIYIENLTKHVEKSPAKVGKIFLELLKNTPEFKKEDIIKIVEVLFQKEENRTANYICNEYRLKGLDFLRETHEKYN
ncbi:hypothetical protein [Methanobacterium oryzae]|uniref:hypothetical protein n=1 Tax=Methanobacterium oryzae TaxID=69540 RepID=UPI003D192119